MDPAQVGLHLPQVGMLTAGKTKEKQVGMKLRSDDESQNLSEKSNFAADLVNWRSLVKNQQED